MSAGASRAPTDLLLNFLKEYHLQGKDEVIRAMLQDICAGSRAPRPLGRWGELSSRDVGDAVAAFEVWKSDGRVSMPALYQSQTHKHNIKCFVLRRNPDGTLDLGSQFADGSLVKRRADPLLVLARPSEGWYVPPHVQRSAEAHQAATASGIIVSDMHHPAASTPAEEVWSGDGIGVGTSRRAAEMGATQQAQVSAAAAGGAAAGEWDVIFSFDGQAQEYGPEYLVLHAGDVLRRLREDQGWAFGEVLRRANPNTVPPAQLKGWYPAEFATLRQT